MSEKTLKFGNVDASKKPIALILVDIDKIVISGKFKHNDKGPNCFIGYTDDNIIRPLYIILPQMDGYINILMMVEKICLLKLKMITY